MAQAVRAAATAAPDARRPINAKAEWRGSAGVGKAVVI